MTRVKKIVLWTTLLGVDDAYWCSGSGEPTWQFCDSTFNGFWV